jgi:hypothetical protein
MPDRNSQGCSRVICMRAMCSGHLFDVGGSNFGGDVRAVPCKRVVNAGEWGAVELSVQRRPYGGRRGHLHEVRIGYFQGGAGRWGVLVLWGRVYEPAREYVCGIVQGAVRGGVLW